MKRSSIGIGAALGDPSMKQKSVDILARYRSEINRSLSWFETKAEKSGALIKGNNFLVIDAKTSISPLLCEAISSILSRSGCAAEGSVLFLMSRDEDETTMISTRICGNNTMNLDLQQVMECVLRTLNLKPLGNGLNARVIINTSLEETFLKNVKLVFEKLSMEELLC